MTDLRVRADERGLVRVFALDIDDIEGRDWRVPDPDVAPPNWQLPAALSAEGGLNPDDVQVFPVSDIAEMGLTAFLEAGYEFEVPADDRARLDAEEEWIAVVRSSAFKGVALSGAVRPPLRLLGIYAEPEGAHSLTLALSSESARRQRVDTQEERETTQTAVADVFRPDRSAYLRTHITLAGVGAVGSAIVLWALGNPHIWVGAVGAPAAVALRGWYLFSEEMTQIWRLSGETLRSDSGRSVALDNIAKVRCIGSAVQVISKMGDKYLIKFQADPQAVRDRIAGAAGISPS